MGYRASILKQHREYGSQPFSDWNAFQNYVSFLQDKYPTGMEDFYVNDAEDFYEIPKVVIEKEIKRLSKLNPEAKVKELDEEVKYVLMGLEECLDEAPKNDNYVALEWY